MKDLSIIFIVRSKFFMCKMQEGDYLVDHINKIKVFANWFLCLDEILKNEDIVWIFLDNLSPSSEYFIIILTSIPMK